MIHTKAERERRNEPDDDEPSIPAWYPQVAFDAEPDDAAVDYLD